MTVLVQPAAGCAAARPSLAEDLLIGAEVIALFVYGDKSSRSRHLPECPRTAAVQAWGEDRSHEDSADPRNS